MKEHTSSLDETRAALSLLLEFIYERTGEDFRQYKHPSMLRRVLRRVEAEGVPSLMGLLECARHDEGCLQRLRAALTLHVTSMFRDAEFFRFMAAKVLPALRTYPYPRLWIAGCSTGQELFSYRILLEELGLGERCMLYGTDLSEAVIETARAGMLDASLMDDYEAAYRLAGGRRSLRDYFEVEGRQMRLHQRLLRNTSFAVHNLISDGSFNEFHLISCRNVLMYLDETGQRRALDVIHQSLAPLGYLGLGNSESMLHAAHRGDYERADGSEPVYRRVR